MSMIARRQITKMSTGHYLIVGGIIRSIPDERVRKFVADHFATEFNRRSKVFDPMQWERLTGGKVAPNSAA